MTLLPKLRRRHPIVDHRHQARYVDGGRHEEGGLAHEYRKECHGEPEIRSSYSAAHFGMDSFREVGRESSDRHTNEGAGTL